MSDDRLNFLVHQQALSGLLPIKHNAPSSMCQLLFYEWTWSLETMDAAMLWKQMSACE